jgi:hypothetical protein
VEKKLIEGCTPRWIFPSKISTLDTNLTADLFLIVLNQTKELEMGIDRKLPEQLPLNDNEIFLTESLLQ